MATITALVGVGLVVASFLPSGWQVPVAIAAITGAVTFLLYVTFLAELIAIRPVPAAPLEPGLMEWLGRTPTVATATGMGLLLLAAGVAFIGLKGQAQILDGHYYARNHTLLIALTKQEYRTQLRLALRFYAALPTAFLLVIAAYDATQYRLLTDRTTPRRQQSPAPSPTHPDRRG